MVKEYSASSSPSSQLSRPDGGFGIPQLKTARVKQGVTIVDVLSSHGQFDSKFARFQQTPVLSDIDEATT
jgi:hypothetical protein